MILDIFVDLSVTSPFILKNLLPEKLIQDNYSVNFVHNKRSLKSYFTVSVLNARNEEKISFIRKKFYLKSWLYCFQLQQRIVVVFKKHKTRNLLLNFCAYVQFHSQQFMMCQFKKRASFTHGYFHLRTRRKLNMT